jgi:hypothetical protein
MGLSYSQVTLLCHIYSQWMNLIARKLVLFKLFSGFVYYERRHVFSILMIMRHKNEFSKQTKWL